MPRSVTRSRAWWVTSRFSIPRTSLRGCQHGGTRAAPGASVERGSALRGGPGPLGAGPGEVPGHSPSPYSAECVEGLFSELRPEGFTESIYSYEKRMNRGGGGRIEQLRGLHTQIRQLRQD